MYIQEEEKKKSPDYAFPAKGDCDPAPLQKDERERDSITLSRAVSVVKAGSRWGNGSPCLADLGKENDFSVDLTS